MSNKDLEEVEFPIHWDSTTLENFIPDFTSHVGYDVPLSARIKNLGAPRFIFDKEEMNIKFGMEVEVWDEDFREYFLSIKYHDVMIDFDMWLEGMNILTDWNTIKMENAEINSDMLRDFERTHANKRVTQFFNYAFDLIIPWANEFHPKGVSSIPIPETIVDLVKIRNLKMAVRDNYFSFTLDPEFIMVTPAERQRHNMIVLSQNPNTFDILRYIQEAIHALFFQY